MSVPRPLVGVIIGKGGEMIKKITNESGARIQLKPGLCSRNNTSISSILLHVSLFTLFFRCVDDGQSPERICQITGTPEQVEAASSLIQNLIETTPAHVSTNKATIRLKPFHIFN